MRIAIVSGPDAGHLLPAAAVGRALADRGHEVAVVTGPEWRTDIEAVGFSHRDLPGISAPDPDVDDIGLRMWGRAAGMAPGVQEVLAELGAELVVADTLTSAGGFAAEMCGLPWVELVPHWLWHSSRVLPPIGLGQRPARTPFGRALESYQRRQQRASFREGECQRAAARAELGLDQEGGPALRLLGTIPALEPPRPDWPRRTFVVGPCEWEPPSWPLLELPPGREPLVVVTDSTASGMEVSPGEAFVAGLDDDDVRLAVTTVREIEPRQGLVSGRGRHGPLLDEAACAAGFAGHGFVGKALVRGVPMVLVPIQGDQRETAARLERIGAAVVVPPEDVEPARLAAAVRMVLSDPSYAKAARRASSSACGLGAGRAAQLVERRAHSAEKGGGRDARG